MTPQDLLSKRNIYSMPKGRDLLVRCLNPDHEDKNPSMRIDAITGVFQCWSCGFKGNLFNHFGQTGNALQVKRQRVKDRISQKLAENVGLEIPINAIPFQEEWRSISGSTYAEFEAFQHSDPKFIGRVVFPIRAPSQKIAAFVGRHQTQNHNPRYLVYPDQAKLPLFPAKVEPLDGRIILVEGLFDMINLWDKGLRNAICAFGTRTLLGKDSWKKLELLKFQGVYGLDIIFDGDEAGQKAAGNVRRLCEDKLEFDVRSTTIANNGDPGGLTASQVIKLKESLYG